jgi:hypothetical protein
MKPIFITQLPELNEDYDSNLTRLILDGVEPIIYPDPMKSYRITLTFIVSDEIDITDHYKFIPKLFNAYNIKSLTSNFKRCGEPGENRLIIFLEEFKAVKKDIEKYIRDLFFKERNTIVEISKITGITITLIYYYLEPETQERVMRQQKIRNERIK